MWLVLALFVAGCVLARAPLKNTPKIVGGVGPASTRLGCALYEEPSPLASSTTADVRVADAFVSRDTRLTSERHRC